MRLLIAQPTYGQVAATCARSMAMLCHRIGHAPPEGLDWLGFEQQSSSNLPELRHKLAANALTVHRATHILWIDSDMGLENSVSKAGNGSEIAFIHRRCDGVEKNTCVSEKPTETLKPGVMALTSGTTEDATVAAAGGDSVCVVAGTEYSAIRKRSVVTRSIPVSVGCRCTPLSAGCEDAEACAGATCDNAYAKDDTSRLRAGSPGAGNTCAGEVDTGMV